MPPSLSGKRQSSPAAAVKLFAASHVAQGAPSFSMNPATSPGRNTCSGRDEVLASAKLNGIIGGLDGTA
jgi:hypothetical protein